MPDISTPNLDYNDMVEAWDINDALMGGTLEMRRQGKLYLPKWPNEDPESYKERLAVATLLPAYEEAIKQNIGRVFAEPTVLSESAPESIRKLSTDIDMEGNRLDVWAQQFFSIGFQYGLVHALVDYPRVDTQSVRTKADEIAAGSRPYVTMLNPRQVIGWKSKVEGERSSSQICVFVNQSLLMEMTTGRRRLNKFGISCPARLKYTAAKQAIME